MISIEQGKVSKLALRLTQTFVPVTSEQEQFPAHEQLSYDNYLTGLQESSNSFEFNFRFGKDQSTQFNHSAELQEVNFNGLQVRRVLIYFAGNEKFTGIQLFDKDGMSLYTPKYSNAINYNARELILQEGERIIGIKAMPFQQSNLNLSDV